ncbi:MAG TPA: hypothetical protein DDX39_01275 [Bacteroidales bacterium]|nr:MAG: hypothetical protein A2W98_07485 [Bacteroidetes bacterium GWF2_33_38]OFY69062.1 MAG: hypothetical protein A2265_05990 [Bacteroidetes bacterium RIFOXYA12_FULL_33_9]OFY89787.1 MAG: hypothetical protein A2236_05350 [Bacteroidetes bacterium RIFOXYA2_FULL_33_7]HBF87243.1 hypothetical protein [Bacteroidales bacterium]
MRKIIFTKRSTYKQVSGNAKKNMRRLSIISILLLISTAIFGQKEIEGIYIGPYTMLRNNLILKRNYTFVFVRNNWESGNGKIYYGKWTYNCDTLTLNYKSYRRTSGICKSRTIKHPFKIKEIDMEKFLLINNMLCRKKTDKPDECYIKEK